MNKTTGALAGVRILDLTRVLAGPFCTMLLADWGAEVIKVESPVRGDDTRWWGPPWVGPESDQLSAYFACVNRNKRSLTVNLKSAAGRQLACDLAARSDVLVENFRPGAAHRLGLAYQDLYSQCPQLVYCTVSGFGQNGPYRDRPGYDYVVQAMGGLMSITGSADGPPTKVGVAIVDVLAGLYASSAILAALHHRAESGQGQHLEVPLFETQISALINVASGFLASGKIPHRMGNEHPNIVPYQVYSARDREFVLAVGNDSQFVRLCKILDRSDLAENPLFETNPRRVENRVALNRELEPLLGQKDADDWVEELLEAGVPAGPVNDLGSVFSDPHVVAAGVVQEVITDQGTPLGLVRSPVGFSSTPQKPPRMPPRLGADTDDILREVLGLDEKRIRFLRDEGVV